MIIIVNNNEKLISKKKKNVNRKFKKNVNRKFKKNDYVLCKFGKDRDELWWPGEIVKINKNNTYNIKYFDGDFEKNKPENKLKKLKYKQDIVDDFVLISYSK